MSDAPRPDGIIDEWLTKVFGRSYRTSIAGAAAGVAGVAALVAPYIPPLAPHAATIASIATLIAGGGLVVAKDARVSGAPK